MLSRVLTEMTSGSIFGSACSSPSSSRTSCHCEVDSQELLGVLGSRLVGWLGVWVVGWLGGLVVRWLVAWLLGCLLAWLVAWLVVWFRVWSLGRRVQGLGFGIKTS